MLLGRDQGLSCFSSELELTESCLSRLPNEESRAASEPADQL